MTGELRKLTELLVDAKEKGVKVVSAVVKRMREKNMFLFGCLEINEGSVTETVNQLTKLQNARIQVLYDKYVVNILLLFFFIQHITDDIAYSAHFLTPFLLSFQLTGYLIIVV